MKSDTIYKLIDKFFKHNLPEEIQKHFRKWWIEDKLRTEKEESMLSIWDNIDVQADSSTYAELEKLHTRIQTPKLPTKRLYLQRILRIAAFFLLPLAGGLMVFLLSPKKIQYIDPQWAEYFVHNGDTEKLILSDGTEVWLNSGSILLYSSNFSGNERRLYLNGEAIFHVVSNPEKPFIVKTHHLEVEVLGTTFNLQAYADSDFSTVTLEEGSLRVATREEDKQVFYLQPDEEVTFSHSTGKAFKEKVDAERVLQWKNGYLIFRGTSFDDIIKTLERQYDVTIRYEAQRFAGRTFTMRFNPDEDILQVLDVMKEMIKGMEYKVRENTIYIN